MLHQRVMGVLRLLGPRHWASWRLLLLGVELHCGALEEAAIKAQVSSALGCVPAMCSQNQICVYVAHHKGRLRGLPEVAIKAQVGCRSAVTWRHTGCGPKAGQQLTLVRRTNLTG